MNMMKLKILLAICLIALTTSVSTATDKGSLCPDVCPRLFMPVCGSDGNNYNNACELRRQSCNSKDSEDQIQLAHTGLCPDPTFDWRTKRSFGHKCRRICTRNIAYICGTNGITFQNSCYLRLFNCMTSSNVTVAHKGPCETWKPRKH